MIIIKDQTETTVNRYQKVSIIENEVLGFDLETLKLTVLGKYKTGKRAKEVFEEVVTSIESGDTYDVMDGKTRTIKHKVFLMPKE